MEVREGEGPAAATAFETTNDHAWATGEGEWLWTQELVAGMQILRAAGAPARVLSVIRTERTAQTYNLEVADFHTYFVGEGRVWVHNGLCDVVRGQIHHIATDKAIKSGFTEKFQQIFKRAGKSLQDPANRMLLEGHAGWHPAAYHQYVLDRLDGATR